MTKTTDNGIDYSTTQLNGHTIYTLHPLRGNHILTEVRIARQELCKAGAEEQNIITEWRDDKSALGFMRAVMRHRIGSWYFRSCGICDSPVGYQFNSVNADVFFDGNCDCVSYWTPPQPRSWGDVAKTYELLGPEGQQEANERFHFSS